MGKFFAKMLFIKFFFVGCSIAKPVCLVHLKNKNNRNVFLVGDIHIQQDSKEVEGIIKKIDTSIKNKSNFRIFYEHCFEGESDFNSDYQCLLKAMDPIDKCSFLEALSVYVEKNCFVKSSNVEIRRCKTELFLFGCLLNCIFNLQMLSNVFDYLRNINSFLIFHHLIDETTKTVESAKVTCEQIRNNYIKKMFLKKLGKYERIFSSSYQEFYKLFVKYQRKNIQEFKSLSVAKLVELSLCNDDTYAGGLLLKSLIKLHLAMIDNNFLFDLVSYKFIEECRDDIILFAGIDHVKELANILNKANFEVIYNSELKIENAKINLNDLYDFFDSLKNYEVKEKINYKSGQLINFCQNIKTLDLSEFDRLKNFVN